MLYLVRPRLVTFDVTGTLLMTKIVEHYTKVSSQHGVSVSNSRELERSFKTNYARLAREHPIYGRHTGLGWENWWRQIVHNVFKDQDPQLNDETLEKVANSLIECYGTSECWHKYPGVVDILEYLKARGIVLGVISNFDERLETILTDVKIRAYFSFVLTSYAHGHEKPDPSLFEEALRLARTESGINFTPEEAIHIGDTLDKDYVGAKNARWNAFLVNHHGKNIGESKIPPAHQFTSLAQLRTHFETELGPQNHSAS